MKLNLNTKNKDLFAVAGVIVVLVVSLFAAFYIAYPKLTMMDIFKVLSDKGAEKLSEIEHEEDTFGLNTYKNDLYGFEIKYPNGISLNGDTQNVCFGLEGDEEFPLDLKRFCAIRISVHTTGHYFDMYDPKKFPSGQYRDPEFSYTDSTINTVPVRQINKDDQYLTDIFRIGDDMSVTISFAAKSTDERKNAQLRKYFEQMVSSFQLNKTINIDFAYWDTYKDDELGFQFKYPQLLFPTQDNKATNDYKRTCFSGSFNVGMARDGEPMLTSGGFCLNIEDKPFNVDEFHVHTSRDMDYGKASLKKIEISGFDAYFFDKDGCPRYYVTKDDKTISFSYCNVQDTSNPADDYFDKIVSTISFDNET